MEAKSIKESSNTSDPSPRVGVYVCRCGHNIGKVVDCAKVAQMASLLENVMVAKEIGYACSDPGQQEIKDDISGSMQAQSV